MQPTRKLLPTPLLIHREGKFGLTGTSPIIESVNRAAQLASKSKEPVLLTGESGAGKEVLALSIHQASERRDRPPTIVHCGILGREELMLSELFGHVRGAFTNAIRDRDGAFVTAHGSTIILDEIGELNPAAQVALLRVLENGHVQAVGSDRAEAVDVRVICLTHRNLLARIGERAFREDLYYRIAVHGIHIPPVRERRQDIPGIMGELLGELNARYQRTVGLVPEVLELLATDPIPGNIRYLQSILATAYIEAANDGRQITPEMLARILHSKKQERERAHVFAKGQVIEHLHGGGAIDIDTEVRDFEIALISAALRATHGNIKEAGRLLGLKRTTLAERMRKAEIRAGSFRFGGNGSSTEETKT